jgi:hypothetical protein
MDPVATFIIAVSVPLVIGLIVRSANSQAVTTGGRTTISYGWGFKGFAIFCGVLTVAPIVGMFFVPSQDRVSLLLIAATFGLPALYLILEGFFVRIVYSELGIEAFSPWRENRGVSWQEISRVSYSPGARWHQIETKAKGNIRLHEMNSGVATLLQELRRRQVDGA